MYKFLKAHKVLIIFLYFLFKVYAKGANLTKCLRILYPLSEIKYESVSAEDTFKKLQLYSAIQYNSIGCVHMKMEKYSLAAVYF